ncbi:MAG: D-aminoacyl-tRNA deacylase, partial [Methanomicrobiaceae archaeon]|nr:D-aminoacyl-tRNA deacylase [Methanomicrobiaceae archaeon]
MKIAFVNSRLDPAGKNIRRHLEELLAGTPHPLHHITFIETEDRLIYQRGIDARAGADLIVFISRHTSIEPAPTLTVHVTGNIGPAAYGGDEGSLARAAPEWMHAVLRQLSRRAPEGYRVSYEVTHHGPTDVHTPSLFVEIGSTGQEWADPLAGRAVAESLLAAEPGDPLNLVGFGGNHYAARQTAIALSSRGAFGHIVHSRQIGLVDERMLSALLRKSGAVAVYIDKKAIPTRELRRIEELSAAIGLPVLSESEILELGGIEWDAYRSVCRLAEEVAPGSKIHLHDLAGSGVPVAVFLNEALLEETLRIDASSFLESLEGSGLAHLSGADGRILPIFIVYEKNRSERIHDLISSCVKIVIQSENTAVEGDRLILRKMRFDPESARKLGVPQGPLFGRLAAGEPISVGDRKITPEMVSICSKCT